MNGYGIAFTIVVSAMLLILPRRLAAAPLLLGATYITAGQVLEAGPAHFTVIRILVAVGFLRVILRNERIAHGIQPLDRLLVWWGILLVGTSAFHMSGTGIYRLGLAWTELGYYFLLRIFLVEPGDIRRMFSFVGVALLPIAGLMLLEKSTGQNPFGWLGGVNPEPSMRHGQIRASGPFVHPILAGGVGATCFGMALYLCRFKGQFGYVGLVSAVGMLYASSSSGPMMMAGFILLSLWAWPLRDHLRGIRWLALVAIIALNAVMNDPFYFLIARIDIAGGSQSWHRAELIRSSIEHLDEWWLAGTDYTRHWMPTGIYANAIHTDMTNHILMMGVMGGLPLMLVFILVLRAGFRAVGVALRAHASAPKAQQFMIWALGAMLFGHVANFFGIYLFDQSVVFFYFVLAAIASFAEQPALQPSKTATSITTGATAGSREVRT